VASTDAAPAATPATPDAGAAAASASDSDNRITSDVKTEVAAAAPNSNVNVTTTNGVVALAGSVPNQDVVNQAKQAAMRVEGVKTVDTSGLLVSNNQ
jgi:hyperosmotically inducible protein